MLYNDQFIRRYQIFGIALVAFSLVSGFIFIPVNLYENVKPSNVYYITIFVVHLYYFLTGLGVLMLRKWGYILFKSFLYLLFICFPVGTFISYKTLSHMKKNNIKVYFS